MAPPAVILASAAPAAPPPPPMAVSESQTAAASRLLASARAARAARFDREAEQIAREALHLDPGSIAAHTLLAAILEERGNRTGAFAELQELDRLNPGSRNRSARRLPGAPLIGHLPQRLPVALLSVSAVIFGVAWWLLVSSLTKRDSLSTQGAAPAPLSQADAAGSAGQISISSGATAGSAFSQAAASGSGAVDASPIRVGDRSAPIGSQALDTVAPPQNENLPASTPAAQGYAPDSTFARSAAISSSRPASIARPFSTSPRRASLPVTLPPVISPRAGGATPSLPSGGNAGAEAAAAPVRVDMTDTGVDTPPRPQNYAAALQRARNSFQSGDYNAAIPEYRQALHAAPNVLATARVRQELGMTYTFTHQPREARGEFNAAEQLYNSQLQGPNADIARRGVDDVQAQLALPENRE